MNVLQPEQTFAQYRIIRRIGVGGMATVFQAVDTQTNQKVALKVLHEQWSYHEIARKRFELEAAIGRNLNHPGIVPIFGYGIEAERPYIVMEYMPGDNLAQEFKKSRSIQLAVTGELLMFIASALDYAHDQGVIHRDLKLENILLDEKDCPVISDFGIAKLIGTTRLTMTGQLIGTPQYMAPELLDTTSDQIDKYVDLYAFAVMAYLMATGYFPFTSPDSLILVFKHKREFAPIPTKVNPKLPRQLNPVLLRGLQKNPTDRYPSAQEFAEAFNKALTDKDGHTTLIFMNELNPVRGKIIKDDALDNAALTPHVSVVNTKILTQNADEEITIPAVALPTSAVTTHSNMGKNRRWLLIASLLLSMAICGGTFALTQGESFSPASMGMYSLPTATLPTATLATVTPLSSYSSQSDAAAQSEIATMTAFRKGEIILGTEITGGFNPTSTSEVQRSDTTTRTTSSGSSSNQAVNTPLPMNTRVNPPTDAPVMNTPIPATNTAIPLPTDTHVPPTPEPIIPTSIPVVPTIVEAIPTAVEIIPTVVNIIPSNPIIGGDTGGGDTGGGTTGGGDTGGDSGNDDGDDGGIELDLPVLPPITLPGLGL
jgi:serine/threonine protein kinase